ncbi:MAG TPA: hypothetical protein VH988_25750, partial [Thermoanaerobaculia bacterium]|nr:hypothetical protein [Thermoanaerobaculia bacterium]
PAGLDRTILSGDHYSLLRRPEVERLAWDLTARLIGIGAIDSGRPDRAETARDELRSRLARRH